MVGLGAALNGLLSRRNGGRERSEVKPGDRYCRYHRNRIAEKVEVLDLRPDSFGIPHVRFTVTFARELSRPTETALRSLALHSFLESYSEHAA
jgi:hypothetical protein